MPLELPRRREAVLIRHLHVEQDDRRLDRLGLGKHLAALRHDRDLEAGAVQQPRHQVVLVLVVVGDEHRLAGLDGHGLRPVALVATEARSSVNALQMSAEQPAGRRLVEAGTGIGRRQRLERGGVLGDLQELGRAGPADQPVGGLLQAEQGVGVAAPSRLDHHRQDFEPAGEAGDEATAPLLDDFLNLSR